MQILTIISSIILLLSLAPAKNEAQIIEECFWECGVEYCDYLDDYCTYDCHEICYPIAKKSSEHGSSNLNGPSHIINTITGKHGNNQDINQQVSGLEATQQPVLRLHEHLAGLNREQTSNMGQLETGRIGKHVKMRIENPAYETVRRGKVVLTRGSPPRGFAMFQDCLSNGRKQPNSTAPISSSTTTTATTSTTSANQLPNLGSIKTPGKQNP